MALSDVAWDRDSRPSHLTLQSKHLFLREPRRDCVHALHELDCFLPCDQVLVTASLHFVPRFFVRYRQLTTGYWQLSYDKAAAPLTISIISLVMAAWRTRLRVSVSESITSLALLVAESIAVIRAACSAATDSSSAW